MEWLQGFVDYGVLGFLLLMSCISLGILLERWLVFRDVRVETFDDKRELELALTDKLQAVATIAATAPYIGLFGTVLGIMFTFYSMGSEGFGMDPAKIMTGLAMALKATAMGLLVAIPSVAGYNFLQRKVKTLMLKWEIQHGPA